MTHKTKIGKCLLQTSAVSFRNTYLDTYNDHVELNFLHSYFYAVEFYFTDMLPRVLTSRSCLDTKETQRWLYLCR